MTKTFLLIALVFAFSTPPTSAAEQKSNPHSNCGTGLTEDLADYSLENTHNILERAIEKAKEAVFNPHLVTIRIMPSSEETQSSEKESKLNLHRTIGIVVESETGERLEPVLLSLNPDMIFPRRLKTSDEIADEIIEVLLRLRAQATRTVYHDLSDRSPRNTKAILETGLRIAKDELLYQKGVWNIHALTYEGSKVSDHPTHIPLQEDDIHPSEWIEIYVELEDGDHGPTKVMLGKLTVERTHGSDLKSSDVIAQEIIVLFEKHHQSPSSATPTRISPADHSKLDGMSRETDSNAFIPNVARVTNNEGSTPASAWPSRDRMLLHGLLDAHSGTAPKTENPRKVRR